MAFFGLKLSLDLEMRAAHPHQKFQGVPPGPKTKYKYIKNMKQTAVINIVRNRILLT